MNISCHYILCNWFKTQQGIFCPEAAPLLHSVEKHIDTLRLFHLYTLHWNVSSVSFFMEKYVVSKPCKCVRTSDIQHHWGLCCPQLVLNDDFVFPVVFGCHPEYEYGADSTYVGDVVVGISVQAYIVAVPCHTWSWITFNCTAHVALVTLWSRTPLQGNDKWWRWLEVQGFCLSCVYFELSWNTKKCIQFRASQNYDS